MKYHTDKNGTSPNNPPFTIATLDAKKVFDGVDWLVDWLFSSHHISPVELKHYIMLITTMLTLLLNHVNYKEALDKDAQYPHYCLHFSLNLWLLPFGNVTVSQVSNQSHTTITSVNQSSSLPSYNQAQLGC